MSETRGFIDNLTEAFVSVLYTGYAPVASGTVGTVPAAVLILFLGKQPLGLPVMAAVLFFLGVAASSRAEALFGRKDPGEIVIDEFVGMLVAMLWLPVTWWSVPVVFLLFRFFDIFKPFPARRCEKLNGGLGVMADDVVAGIYANLAYRLLTLIF